MVEMIRKLKKIFFGFLIFCFFPVACQTLDSSLFREGHRLKETVLKGQWKGNLLIRRGKESLLLKIYFYALKGENLRIDVTTSFSIPIFSFILSKENFQYIFYQEKKYLIGQVEKLKDLKLVEGLSLPFHPALFYFVLFDEFIKDKNLNCRERIGKRYFQSCQSLGLSLSSESFPLGKKRIFLAFNPEGKHFNFKGKEVIQGKEETRGKEAVRGKKAIRGKEVLAAVKKTKGLNEDGKKEFLLSIEIHLNRFILMDKNKEGRLMKLFEVKRLKKYRKIGFK